MTGYIYGLICPIENEIRYIGLTTKSINHRKNKHITSFKHKLKVDENFKKNYKESWFFKLYKIDKLNDLEVILLEECDLEILYEREKFWINKYFEENKKLTNLKDYGYKGCDYKNGPMLDEYKIKISEGLKEFWKEYKNSDLDKQRIIKIKETKLERYNKLYFEQSLEAKQRVKERFSIIFKGEGNPFYGKKHTDETKQKMINNHQDYKGENNPFYGKNHTDETKLRIKEKRNKQIMISKKIGLYNKENDFLIKEYLNMKDLMNDLKLNIKERSYYNWVKKNKVFNGKYLKYIS